MKKKLYLITTEYPNAGGDSVFVLPELKELAKKFDVNVICTTGKGKCESTLDNIHYYFYSLHLTLTKKVKYCLMYPFNKQCRKEFLDIWKNRRICENFVGRLRKSIEFYACAEEFYQFFHHYVDRGGEKKDAIFYTFWCNEFCLPMILHKRNYPGYHLITRLHRFDLYEECYLYGRQPFKKVINQYLEKLYFVGEMPMRYYVERHPELEKKKVEVLRLGVYKIDNKRKKKYESSTVLVSCSNIIPVKRVHLIVEALALMEQDIKWIHFGAGSSMEDVMQLAHRKLNVKKNIDYDFRGNLPNEQIRKFYEENVVDLFITTTSSEGCPVSVMEALAAGIPVIGTAVGDIPFMIDGNGILLDENPSVDDIASALKWMIDKSREEKLQMSRKSLQMWEKYFDAEKNAPLVAEEICNILS